MRGRKERRGNKIRFNLASAETRVISCRVRFICILINSTARRAREASTRPSLWHPSVSFSVYFPCLRHPPLYYCAVSLPLPSSPPLRFLPVTFLRRSLTLMRGYTSSHLRSTSVSLRFLVSFAHSDLWLVLLTAVFAGYGVRANVARRASPPPPGRGHYSRPPELSSPSTDHRARASRTFISTLSYRTNAACRTYTH